MTVKADSWPLLTKTIDDTAAVEPDRVAYVIPKTSDLDDGFRDITYSRIANGINRFAQWIESHVGKPTDDGYEPLPYIGPIDLRYVLLVFAANKVNHSAAFLSPRNSHDAQRYLLGALKAKYFLCSAGEEPAIREIVSKLEQPVQVLVVPSAEDLLDETPVPAYEFKGTMATHRHRPFVITHTSGTTTGKPKPIHLNHGYYILDYILDKLPSVDGKSLAIQTYRKKDIRSFFPMPLFHVGGVFFAMFKVFIGGITCIIPPAEAGRDAVLMEKSLRLGKCESGVFAPFQLDLLTAIPSAREYLSSMKEVLWGSGPMTKKLGDDCMSLNTMGRQGFGATEFQMCPMLELEDPVNDWQWFEWHPWAGIEMQHMGSDQYELVLKRIKNPEYEGMQPVFENWPDTDEYRSKDLFIQHPTKPNHWKWNARKDDVVVFENGEMFNPTEMEEMIGHHPKATKALVIGKARSQAAVLIEVKEDATSLTDAELIEEYWPVVAEANKLPPTYGQILKRLVLPVRTAFPRTPKGTIQRSKAEELFTDVIEAAYHSAEDFEQGFTLKDIESEASIKEFVGAVCRSILDLPKDMSDDFDLFSQGLDSLKASEIARYINTGLKKQAGTGNQSARLNVSVIYNSPSINTLSKALFAYVHPGSANASTEDTAWPETMERLMKRYTPDLSAAKPSPTSLQSRKDLSGAAILTGSTGSLGAHLLHILLHDNTYTHVYCLNRSSRGEAAFVATFPADAALAQTKATFLETPLLAAPFFGLTENIYAQLQSSVKTVFHNAWPVHFLLPIEAPSPTLTGPSDSFEPHIKGISSLLTFSATSALRPRILYVSSLASVSALPSPLPEAISSSPAAPQASGYPRSKAVAERLLSETFTAHPDKIPRPIVVRPGQIAGPCPEAVQPGANGVGASWNAAEYIPSLLISSACIAALPASLGAQERARWAPVDVVAQTTVDAAAWVDTIGDSKVFDGAVGFNVLNLNPDRAKTVEEEVLWSRDLLGPVKERLESKLGREVQVVDPNEWIKRVEEVGVKEGENGKTLNPAVRLLDFYSGMLNGDPAAAFGAGVEIENSRAASKTFRSVEGVKVAWMERWLQDWGL